MEDRIVVIDPGTGDALTADGMDARIAATAVRLRRRGLRQGDQVVVSLDAHMELVVVAESVIAAGGVVVLLAPGDKLIEHLGDCDARMMISDVPEAIEAAERSHIRQVLHPGELRRSYCAAE